MGGKQEKTDSEIKVKTQLGTDKAEAEGPVEPRAARAAEDPGPAADVVATLRAILPGAETPQSRWPGEALKSVLARLKRMPRGGWPVCHSIFCSTFQCGVSLAKFRRLAESVIVTNTGKRCSRRKFGEESSKRVKTIDAHFEERNLYEARVYGETKQRYHVLMQKALDRSIDQAEWTRKLTHDEVDLFVLGAVNQAVGDYATHHPPTHMSDIARLIQVAQLCYQEATSRERKPSEWRASIEKKIANNRLSKDLLDRKLAGDILSEKELKVARRTAGEMNLIIDVKRDLLEAISRLEERIRVYESKIHSAKRRQEFRAHNRSFELYRARFYKSLAGEQSVEHSVTDEQMREFWDTMWNKREADESAYDEYLDYNPPSTSQPDVFPSLAEFTDMIGYLPNWKAAGPDGIYNFFIKKCTSIHAHLYWLIRKVCLNGEEQAPWFYRGITYLIPKGVPSKGSDFRPITCMSNLYKLTTRCVAAVMSSEVEFRGLLSENQLGTVARVQGAKEQAMLNIVVNQKHGNRVKATWLDVRKAFDSVDHSYLLKCIERLQMPEWILRFLGSSVSKWEIVLRSGRNEILRKRIARGILQGDSLSPLLFVLCIDPLSKRLNARHPKLEVNTEHGMHVTNHLFFVDDLKLLALDDDTLARMTKETKRFYNAVGLEINREKSATNSSACVDTAVLLEGAQAYKYLGLTEDSRSVPTRETWLKVKTEIRSRVERLCRTRLNAKHLVKAINEHAISLINYYVGLLRLEPSDFAEIDFEIRQVLSAHGIHKQPACLERLYLPRTELGRGIHSVQHKSEHMLLQLNAYLTERAPTSTRQAAILEIERAYKTHLATIREYLQARYDLKTELTAKSLTEAQKAALYSEISKKTRHEKLYRARANERVSVADSSRWLSHGNVSPQDEARYCLMQDRNMFADTSVLCPHCRSRHKTVDHLATQCDRMLYHDYMRRHNEVVRCIHLCLCRKYGLKALPRMRTHAVQEVVANENVEIRVDMRVNTGIKIQANRPDILVHDKKRKEIILIEVGITGQDRLHTVETEKARKYDVLANKLGQEMQCKTKTISYVMTWDGVVTKYHRKYSKEIGLTDSIEAYIQTVVLKKTLESISFDHRRGLEPEDASEELAGALNGTDSKGASCLAAATQ